MSHRTPAALGLYRAGREVPEKIHRSFIQAERSKKRSLDPSYRQRRARKGPEILHTGREDPEKVPRSFIHAERTQKRSRDPSYTQRGPRTAPEVLVHPQNKTE